MAWREYDDHHALRAKGSGNTLDMRRALVVLAAAAVLGDSASHPSCRGEHDQSSAHI